MDFLEFSSLIDPTNDVVQVPKSPQNSGHKKSKHQIKWDVTHSRTRIIGNAREDPYVSYVSNLANSTIISLLLLRREEVSINDRDKAIEHEPH